MIRYRIEIEKMVPGMFETMIRRPDENLSLSTPPLELQEDEAQFIVPGSPQGRKGGSMPAYHLRPG
jgi:hypothetical protein